MISLDKAEGHAAFKSRGAHDYEPLPTDGHPDTDDIEMQETYSGQLRTSSGHPRLARSRLAILSLGILLSVAFIYWTLV